MNIGDDIPWNDEDIPREESEEAPHPGPRKMTQEELEAMILKNRYFEEEEDVLKSLRRRPTKSGDLVTLPSALNVQIILSTDTRWGDAIRLNTFSGRVWLRLPGEDTHAECDDTAPTAVQLWLEQVYKIQIPRAVATAAIAVAAKATPWHPVREALDGVQWDGEPRVDALLCRYFGVEDTSLTRMIARTFMVSCIARIRDPGCKVDTVLVLCGGQGAGKSRALRILALQDEWFSDTEPDWASKDFFQSIPGKWIYEIQEIDHALRANNASRVKSLLSSQVDHYRSSYGIYATGKPRQTVFVGTTNEREFLRDRTGNRRFQPVTIGKIDHAALQADIAQLWAEADVLYQLGEPVYLGREDAERQAADALNYTESDPWEAPIEAWTSARLGDITSCPDFTTETIYTEVLSIADRTRWTPQTDHRIASILRGMGFAIVRPRMDNGTRPRVWRRA